MSSRHDFEEAVRRLAGMAQRLEGGECAADALKATLGRVPAIALRNLIRDLGSKC